MSIPSSSRRRAANAFSGGEDEPEEAISNGLRIGTDYLDVSVGFLTRIDDGRQEIVRTTGSSPSIRPGEQCPLEEAYCRRTVEVDGAFSVQNAAESDRISDDAVERFGLGAYVGAKITVSGEVYGTVCFADDRNGVESFSETEELFVELLAERIGNAMERQSYQAALSSRTRRLKTERHRFEEVAAASADAVFRIGDDAEFRYVSTAMGRSLGYDRGALVGESFRTVLAPGSVDDAVGLYRRVLDGDAAEGVELALETADGEVEPFEINVRPIDDAEGGTAIQGVARNVADRKARRRELEIKNRAMDEAGIGIVIADATREDNPITYVNDEFCRITGYGREAVLGSNCRFLQGAATESAAVARLGRGIAAEEPVSVDVVNYRDSGSAFWNEVSVTPVEDETGEVVQYIGFQRDVTERKRRQQLLGVMNRVLRHNLRNEMSIVLGAAGHGEEGAAMIRDAADELLSLADRARELYTYAEGDRDPTRIDPGAVFDDIRDVLAGDRPDVTLERTVRTDRAVAAGSELTAAVTELVENAYTHDSDPDTTIELTARDDGDALVVTVVDDGPGIDEMERRAVASGQESALDHGSGLGLWLVNWVVTRYGGSFRIESRDAPDGGTEATIRLPAVGPEESVAEVDSRPTTLAA